MEPCAIILVDDGEGYDWECYNCGHDPDGGKNERESVYRP